MRLLEIGAHDAGEKRNICFRFNKNLSLIDCFGPNSYYYLNILNIFIGNVELINSDKEIDYYILFEEGNNIFKYIKCFENTTLLTEILFMDDDLVAMLDTTNSQIMEGPVFNKFIKKFDPSFKNYEIRLTVIRPTLFNISNFLSNCINKIILIKRDDRIGSTLYKFSKLTEKLYCDIIPKLDIGVEKVEICNHSPRYYDKYTGDFELSSYFGSGMVSLTRVLPFIIESIIRKDLICVFDMDVDPIESLHPMLARALISLYKKYEKRSGQIISYWYRDEDYDELKSDLITLRSEEPINLIFE